MMETPTSPVEALTPEPHGAVRLVVDGRAVLTAPIEAVRAEGVAVGSVVSPEVFQRLCEAAEGSAAYSTALKMMERRPFAGRELARRLKLKGHRPEAAQHAVDRARQAGLVDDERFARHFVQVRLSRGLGPSRLRRELMVRGVGSTIVERVLDEEVPEDGGQAALLALAQKRARQLAKLEPADRFRRVVAYLARRGYSGSEVRRLVREVI